MCSENNNGFVQYTAESTLAKLELTLLAGQSSGQSSIQSSGQSGQSIQSCGQSIQSSGQSSIQSSGQSSGQQLMINDFCKSVTYSLM